MRPKTSIPEIHTLTVEFEYESDYTAYQITAQVERDGIDSYTAVNLEGCDDVSDHLYNCIKEMAEEKAWLLEQKPKNPKTGCDCLPKVSPLAQALHDEGCPLRLEGAEREAFNDLLRKEKRDGHRMSKADLKKESL